MQAGEQTGEERRDIRPHVDRVLPDPHSLVGGRVATDEHLAGPHLAPVLVALVRLEAGLADADVEHLGDAHGLADRGQVRGQVRDQRRRPGVRRQQDRSGRHGAVGGRHARHPPSARHDALHPHAGDDRAPQVGHRLEQPVAEPERVELRVARRPFRGAHLVDGQSRCQVAQLVGSDDADLHALRGLEAGHPADVGLLGLVEREVERAGPVPLDPARQLRVPALEQLERAARVVQDRPPAGLLDEPRHAREVSAQPGEGHPGVAPRGAPGRGIRLDHERPHPGPRQVVGRRGADHAAADHHDLGARRQLGAPVGHEGHRLGLGREGRLAVRHQGAERTIGR